MAADGLITIPSSNSVKATLDRLESEVKARGIAVFARIDHAAGATRAGLALRPTELLIFGNAIAGTPLMQAAQTIGIDLPLKALAWEDASGRVAVVQRSGLACATSRARRVVRRHDRRYDCAAREHRAKSRNRAVTRGAAWSGSGGKIS
jgi:uncharacterized protein (DUF302 family)